MKTKSLVIVALLAFAVMFLSGAQQRNYRPKRWTHAPEALTVLNPDLVFEPLVAVHAIRWRDRALRHAVGTNWQMVVEIANTSRFDVVHVNLRFDPYTNPTSTNTTRSLTIERGEPVWAIVYLSMPHPPAVTTPPTRDRKPAKPTNITRPPHGPRFQDITIQVLDFNEG